MIQPNVTFILVSYNSARSIAAALDSILAQTYPVPLMQISVVDNHSTDGTPDLIQARYPAVTLIANQRNVGFAAACHLAAAQSRAGWLALINPDVTLHPDWLAVMLRSMQDDSSIAAAGCKLYFADGVTLHSVGGILRARGYTAHHGAYEVDRGQCDALADVDYAVGAAVLIRRAVWTQLGGFDTGFFLYFEDLDLCLRARAHGYRVIVVPGATARHHEQFSTAGRHGTSLRYLWHYHRSRLRFLWKWRKQVWQGHIRLNR